MPRSRAFAEFHAQARRVSRRPEEVDDLVQSALLAALESGRTDLAAPETRRWLSGVIRNRAMLDARTAVRRRRRDSAWADQQGLESAQVSAHSYGQEAALAGLSPALRLTVLLALSGHTRQEIGWLLNISDEALRQRISQLKRALASAPAPSSGPAGALAFGRIRRALLAPARRSDVFLASHDPDGHLFVVSRSQSHAPRQQKRG